ncbi:ferredoxin [Nocardia callitridis]|uniref:Ferredoxin n=1 Tax=Nocardia callitridis TaxID=648753 RepID=A0ABP9K7X2_9NOCA
MKVLLDEDKCIGSGQCVMAAPEVFDQRDEDGIAFLLTDAVTDDEPARQAARICPALAIEVSDE